VLSIARDTGSVYEARKESGRICSDDGEFIPEKGLLVLRMVGRWPSLLM
jgi:hypothetical protein